MKKIYDALVTGIREYFHGCGFQKALLGLSGGIDSALVATLAAEALGKENVRGISMPSQYSSQHSKDDARDLAENLGIRYDVVPIGRCFETLKAELAPIFEGLPEGLAEENMQARLRGIILMSVSNKLGGMVLATGNKSEVSVGYCTLYGDTCGGLAPISDLYKTEVYQLSYWINEHFGRAVIPTSTLTKAPSAELRPGQKDQDSLPPYEVLDAVLKLYNEEHKTESQIVSMGYDPATVKRVLELVRKSAYKRKQLPPGLPLRNLLDQ